MSELQESIQAAVANASDKIAETESVQEAQAWQSIISNLNSIYQQIGVVEAEAQPQNVPTVDPVVVESTTDEINVEDDGSDNEPV